MHLRLYFQGGLNLEQVDSLGILTQDFLFCPLSDLRIHMVLIRED